MDALNKMRFLGPDATEQSQFKCIVHVMYHKSTRWSHREHNRIKPQTWLTAVQICILVHNPLLMPSPIELSLTRCVNCTDTITVHLHFGYLNQKTHFFGTTTEACQKGKIVLSAPQVLGFTELHWTRLLFNLEK